MEGRKEGNGSKEVYKFDFDEDNQKIVREKNLLLLSAIHYVHGVDWVDNPDWKQVAEAITNAKVAVYSDSLTPEVCEKQYLSLVNYGYQVGVGVAMRTRRAPSRLLEPEKRLWILASTSNDLVRTSQILDTQVKSLYLQELKRVEVIMACGFEETLKFDKAYDGIESDDDEECEEEAQTFTEEFSAAHSQFLKETLGLSQVLQLITYCSGAVEIAVNELPRLVVKRQLVRVNKAKKTNHDQPSAIQTNSISEVTVDLNHDIPGPHGGVVNTNTARPQEVDSDSLPETDSSQAQSKFTAVEPEPVEKVKVETFTRKPVDNRRASSPDITEALTTTRTGTTKVLRSSNYGAHTNSSVTAPPKIPVPARISPPIETVTVSNSITEAIVSDPTETITNDPAETITASPTAVVASDDEETTGNSEEVTDIAETDTGITTEKPRSVPDENVPSDTDDAREGANDETFSSDTAEAVEATTEETSESEVNSLADKSLPEEICNDDVIQTDTQSQSDSEVDLPVVTEPEDVSETDKDVGEVSVEEIPAETDEVENPINEETLEDTEPQSADILPSVINEESDESQLTTVSTQSHDLKDEESAELNAENKIIDENHSSSNDTSNMSEDIVTGRKERAPVVDEDDKSSDINPPTPPRVTHVLEIDLVTPTKSPQKDADVVPKTKGFRKSRSNPTRSSSRLNSPEPVTDTASVVPVNDESKPGKRQRGRHGSKSDVHVPVLRSRRAGTPTKSIAIEKITEPEEPPTPEPEAPTKVDSSTSPILETEETPDVHMDIAPRSSPAEVEDKMELELNTETKHKELQVYKAKLPSPLSHVDPRLFGVLSDEDDPELAMIDSNANKNREEKEKSPEIKSYSRKGRTVSSENTSDPGNEEKSRRKRLTRRTLKHHDATIEASIQDDSTPTGHGSDKATSESSFIRKPKKTRTSKHGMRLKRLREEQQQFFGDADSDCSDGKRVTRARAKTGTGSSSKRTQLSSVGDSEGLSEPETLTPKRKSRKSNLVTPTTSLPPQLNLSFPIQDDEYIKMFRKNATTMLTKIIESKQGQTIHRMSTDDPDRIIKHRVDFQSIRRKVDVGLTKEYAAIQNDLFSIGINILYSHVGRRNVGEAIIEYKGFVKRMLEDAKASGGSVRIEESDAESISSVEERIRPSGSGTRRKRKRSTSETSNEEVFNAENRRRVTRTSTSSASASMYQNNPRKTKHPISPDIVAANRF